jgi:hypothetical protein
MGRERRSKPCTRPRRSASIGGRAEGPERVDGVSIHYETEMQGFRAGIGEICADATRLPASSLGASAQAAADFGNYGNGVQRKMEGTAPSVPRTDTVRPARRSRGEFREGWESRLEGNGRRGDTFGNVSRKRRGISGRNVTFLARSHRRPALNFANYRNRVQRKTSGGVTFGKDCALLVHCGFAQSGLNFGGYGNQFRRVAIPGPG